MRLTFLGVGVMCGVMAASDAMATPLLNLSGRIGLLDGASPAGVKVQLGIDVNRDGKLNSFEIATGTVGSNGRYTLAYEPDPSVADLKFVQYVVQLLADYQARGFAALLDDGPLPVVLRFDREGYSTVIKRFTTLSDAPSLDVVMQPLAQIQCTTDGCMSTDGEVQISGFPGGTGIARAFARAYDPETNGGLFPGTFTDNGSNLLISSGFTEVDLRDENGNKIHALSSPVSVRFEAKKSSWASLRDLEPNSGKIEVPMYSFDEDSGQWISESPGVLQDSAGGNIAEDQFAAIQAGDYTGSVFVSFQTAHFSSFNCDAPISRRACVKGRLVVHGHAVAGARVSVDGVSYTGTAGSVITGTDGTFASDLMKSELTGEDVDGNGHPGETFSARISASATLGVYIGDTFNTPTVQGSISVSASSGCQPAACDCIDLGDIEATFEPARACQVTVQATYSGVNIIGADGPLMPGDAIVGAKLSGSLSGQVAPQIDPTLCQGVPCGSATADANGVATFIVPVIGKTPKIELQAHYSTTVDGETHYYDGSLVVDACARTTASVDAGTPLDAGADAGADASAGATPAISLEAQHAALGSLSDFIASLGAGPAVPSGSGGPSIPSVSAPKIKKPSCGCRTVGLPSGRSHSSSPHWALAALALAAFARRKRSTH